MVELGRTFEQFKLDITAECCKEMIGLCGHRLSW